MTNYFPKDFMNNIVDINAHIGELFDQELRKEDILHKTASNFVCYLVATAGCKDSSSHIPAGMALDMLDPFFDNEHGVIYLRCKYPDHACCVVFQQYADVTEDDPFPINIELYSYTTTPQLDEKMDDIRKVFSSILEAMQSLRKDITCQHSILNLT